jgi:hypothetical protein
MTDEQLAQYLGIADDPRWPGVIANITQSQRQTYERMATLEIEIDLWHKGLGPKPRGVLIDMAKTPRRAKKLTQRLRKRMARKAGGGVGVKSARAS